MVSGKEWNQLMEEEFWRAEGQRVEKSSLYLTKEDTRGSLAFRDFRPQAEIPKEYD